MQTLQYKLPTPFCNLLRFFFSLSFRSQNIMLFWLKSAICKRINLTHIIDGKILLYIKEQKLYYEFNNWVKNYMELYFWFHQFQAWQFKCQFQSFYNFRNYFVQELQCPTRLYQLADFYRLGCKIGLFFSYNSTLFIVNLSITVYWKSLRVDV